MSRLRPPRSPPGQSLSVGALDVGVTIEGLKSRFRVLPGRLPGAHLESLAFTLGGGRFSLRDTTVAPDSGRFAFDLEVEDLALERILPQIGIEGLSGQGGLSGTLPVQVLDGSAVVIAKGRLGTSGPGILRYRSAALSSSLPPDADALDLFRSPLDLAILALRDFHYDSLAITLDKEAGGRSKLFLELEGRNPALLEGSPFKFNINLTGNVNPILDAVRRGSALSDALLRETWTLRP